jgi:RNA polymerase sigma factor (sigma-70 family)
MDDHELLREFATNQAESAFAELVARHVNHVYTTAVRLVGDHAQAQDVVQAVFISLARQAGALQHSRALGGWLYRVTCNCAKDAWRSEQRRRRREAEAMRIAELNESAPAWEAVAPLLDEALGKLKSGEQNAVVLRFFEGKSLRETGAELGLSEDAAQKRIVRALEKMRAHFARGGVTVAIGALSAVMATNTCKAAPMGLAARVTGPSLAGAGEVGAGSILTRILFMSTKTKVLTAVIVVALVIVVIGIKLAQPQAAVIAPGDSAIAKVATNLSSNKTPAVELPKAPAVPAHAETVAAAAGADPPSDDPQADLKTAIPELVRLVEANDWLGVYKAYTPPDRLDPKELQTLEKVQKMLDKQLSTPQAQLQLQMQHESAVSAWEALETQTPTYNATGDEATYLFTTPDYPGPTVSESMTFIKINGKWYQKLPDAKGGSGTLPTGGFDTQSN